MAREDCFDAIAARTGIPREEVMNTLSDLDERAQSYEQRGMNRLDAYKKASKDRLDDEAELRAAHRRASVIDMHVFQSWVRDARARYAEGHPFDLIIKAMLDGTNTEFWGSRISIGSDRLTFAENYAKAFEQILDNDGTPGLVELFASREMQRDWALELSELNRGVFGKTGITKNDKALKIANAAFTVQKQMMADHNAVGGWTKPYAGFVIRMNHDADLVNVGGRTAATGLKPPDAMRLWTDSVKKNADLKRTFGPLDVDAILPEMWKKLANGEHENTPAVDLDDPHYSSLAVQSAAHKVIHWRSVDHWMDYNNEFGHSSATQGLYDSFMRSAERTALMKHLGTKPRLGFMERIDWVRQTLRDKPEELKAFDAKVPGLKNIYNQFDRSENTHGNRMVREATTGTMALNRWSMLGRVMFTHGASLYTQSAAGRAVGMGFGERYANLLSGFMRGAKDSDKRAGADIVSSGAVSRLGRMLADYNVVDARKGRIARWDARFFRATGVLSATENKGGDFERMHARHLGMQRDKSWSELDPAERHTFDVYRVGEPEWNVLKTVDWWKDGEGKEYLMPSDARGLSDETMRDLLSKTGNISERALPITEARINQARDDLVHRLATMYYDQSRFAIVRDPSAKIRAFAFQGSQQHAPNLYQAMKLFWQFRMWPAEMIDRTWGRMIYGRGSLGDKLATFGETAVAALIFGSLFEAFRELTKGLNPVAEIRAKPAAFLLRGFLRGGLGTIAGDFLLGEYDRHGMSWLGMIAGPTYGQVTHLQEIKDNIVTGVEKGKWRPLIAGTVHDIREHIPFIDMWWFFHAIDYFIVYRVLEAINPGYIQRMEDRMKKQQGSEFLLSPQRTAGGGLSRF